MLLVIATLVATVRAVDRESKKPAKQPTPEQARAAEDRELGYLRVKT